MKVKIEIWEIKDLISIREKINPQPRYQRGEVWKKKKKSLLVDSIMRDIDMPKIYLRKLISGAFDYEVADGQQRLNAIYDFKDGLLELPRNEDKGLDLSKVNSVNIGGFKYTDAQFPAEFRRKFDKYPLTIAIVEDATNHEIRVLFGRLQEGETLTPAEKRNALISHLHAHVDNFALNHIFFKNSYISEERFKRQDYVSHVLALIAYNNAHDLKADLLLHLYLDKTFRLKENILYRIDKVLGQMFEIDKLSTVKIYKKHHFVDFFWFLYQEDPTNVDCTKVAAMFDVFEADRLNHQDDPKRLITGKKRSTYHKNLYEYILAFRYDGSNTLNISNRNKVFKYLFKKLTN